MPRCENWKRWKGNPQAHENSNRIDEVACFDCGRTGQQGTFALGDAPTLGRNRVVIVCRPGVVGGCNS